MPEPLCILTVHAHPDDESSKGAGTIARYHHEGVHTVLVCCTGGEEGDILNPALDTPDIRDRLPEVRREELAQATAIIGYDEVVMLGYRDSGMADSEANANPTCFAQAPLEEAVERLVAIVRRCRPQVMVIYADDQSGYPHPDHLRVHEIGIVAFRAAGDPQQFLDAGDPWQPMKLYYTTFSVARFREVHAKFVEMGLESPFDEVWQKRWSNMADAPSTTSVDISDYGHVRREALLAHATQVDPTSRFWFGLPPDVMDKIHPHDDYQLAMVASETSAGIVITDIDSQSAEMQAAPETDLFAGVSSAA